MKAVSSRLSGISLHVAKLRVTMLPSPATCGGFAPHPASVWVAATASLLHTVAQAGFKAAPSSGLHVPSLAVHGGAWDIPEDQCDAHKAGMQAAIAQGRKILLGHGSAVEAVEATVASMEDSGVFDAGRGAVLTQRGNVELDAGIMCGATQQFGALSTLTASANPIQVARRLMDVGTGQVRFLAGPAADAFAIAEGFDPVNNRDLVCAREIERFLHLCSTRSSLPGSLNVQRDVLEAVAAEWRSVLSSAVHAKEEDMRPQSRSSTSFHTSDAFMQKPSAPPASPSGTVGCVALDAQGRLAAGTSTGGTPFRPSGRIGDSPMPGSGYFASDSAAVSATGWGEAIAAMAMSVRMVDALGCHGAMRDSDSKAHHTPAECSPETQLGRMQELLRRLHERVKNSRGDGATAGFIAVDALGHTFWVYNTPRMARGGWHASSDQVWAEC